MLQNLPNQHRPFFLTGYIGLYNILNQFQRGITSNFYPINHQKKLPSKLNLKMMLYSILIKMKILSYLLNPQVVPNLYECLCSAEHKGRYSEECWKQSSSGAPLTSIVFFFSYYGSQWCPKTPWLQTFFEISSFEFGRTKKFIQVWNYLRIE